jgi:hypothetical protein
MTDANRLKVYWQKGRNYFQSLFSELSELQETMAPAEFAKWCREELGLTVGILVNASNILKKVDAILVKEHLSAARAADLHLKMQMQVAKAKEKELQKVAKKEMAAAKKEAASKKKKQIRDRRYRKRKKAKEKTKSLLAAE